jgi:hypothetical protein
VSLRDLVLEPMILLDVVPSRTYFVSIFEERGLTPNIVFSSPSIEMVRGMVGRFRLFDSGDPPVRRVHLRRPESGACRWRNRDRSGLSAAWLRGCS